jgi:hypothetical protein
MAIFVKDFGKYTPPAWAKILLKILHSCPKSGVGRKLILLLRKPLCIFLSTIDTSVGQIRLRVHLKDNISERKFLTMPQFFDSEELELISTYFEFHNQDPVFVDIGANVGIYSLWAALSMEGKGIILAIEPNPSTYERLMYNCALNDFSGNIKGCNVALSDHEGFETLYVGQNNLGEASCVHKTASPLKVKALRLSTLLSNHKIKKVDILKIDVEGAEPTILRDFFDHAAKALYPKILIVENSISSDFSEYLKKQGYTLSARTKMNFIFRWD